MKKNKTTERPKKSPVGIILLVILLIAAIAGAGTYYYLERKKPEAAVETFLGYVQQMDFDGMTSLLQSEDLSALNNTDVRDTAFSDFFGEMNQKMTYKIVKNNFDISNGTANVTARIHYVNGTDLYKEASTDFIRQILSAAFAGTEMTEEELHAKLVELLKEKSQSMPETYMDTEIIYPLISIGKEWKIVSLDDATINVMSANFHSVEKEINSSLEAAQNGTEMDVIKTPSAGDLIDMSTDKFSIHYTQFRLSRDLGDQPCILIYYDYTNNGSVTSSAMVDVHIQAYQSGQLCDPAIPETTEDALDKYMEEVQPGGKVNVCQAFSLKDDSEVTIQAGEASSFGGGQITQQIIKIQ